MKTRSLLTAILLLFFCLEGFSQSTVCSYGYRRKITFNPAQVVGSSDLIDFPVYINIVADNDLRTLGPGGHVTSNSGYDIIFTASDGVTVLDHDLRNYVFNTGSVQFWVKIPRLSTTQPTYIYMYYGNASVISDQSSDNTWSNGYVGVWHFDNSLNNSSSTANINGTNVGTGNSSTAMFTQARSFNGTSQYIDISPYNPAYDLTEEITVSAWIRPAATGANQRITGNQNNSTGGWKLSLASNDKVEFEIRNSSNVATSNSTVSGGTTLAASNWYYVVGQYSNSNDLIQTYRNGVSDRTLTTTALTGTSNATMKVGREAYASSGFFNGNIDELRLSNVIRSADWIATEYNNQIAPSTFFTLSPEPVKWDGSSSTSWNTGANWSSNVVPPAYSDAIIVNVANDPVLGISQQLGSLWIQSGATLTVNNSNTLSLVNDVTNCGTLLGLNSSVINFNSTNSYVSDQYMSGSGVFTFINLLINNTHSASPGVTLKKDINVLGFLQLNSGILYTTSTNLLFMTLNANASSGSANSFVSGPMSKNGNAAFVFPVGKGTKWRRIGISAAATPTSNSTFRAEYFDTGYSNVTTVTSPLIDVSKNEYWQLDRTSGSGSVTVSLYWENASMSGINDCTDLEIARWNGSSWVRHDATAVGGSSCSGTGTGTITTNAIVSSFSPFGFGSGSSVLNPLPIELLSFTNECSNAGVSLAWSTATEKNSAYFEVQSSSDGLDWVSLDRIKAAGNSLKIQEYTYIDDRKHYAPVYYRLKQTDLDGTYEYSPVTVATCISTVDGIVVYPNPAEKEVLIEGTLKSSNGTATVLFLDFSGRVCKEEKIDFSNNLLRTKIILDLSPGAYMVKVIAEEESMVPKKLIIR